MKAFELFKPPDSTLKIPKKPLKVLGIDLGTTNSTVAEVTLTPEEVICQTLDLDQITEQGVYTSPLVPSVVAILPDNQIWVGEGAKRLRSRPQEHNLMAERNLFYETKNDMGLRRTYYRAAEPFNHASKIAGQILRFLMNASMKLSVEVKRLAVSVPASFQLNQRRDTLLACEYAGLRLEDDDLIDEPTAALIDYFHTDGRDKIVALGEKPLVVVFDFGGGTCDVSILELKFDRETKSLSMSQLSISRYHRLGGGDIDAAIVHECLIPAILKENGLNPLDLSWAEKKRGLEPQLLGTAEALKIALCKEIDRLINFGKYDETDKSQIVSRQPSITCNLKKRTLHLPRPSLSAAEFENLLKPFLDKDFLYARETEYRQTQSIFAPLRDALDRAGKGPEEIDFCLIVGGSTLIPQVRKAIEEYFCAGQVGYFQDPLSAQLAIARGAAWNALFKELFGVPLVRPILHDAIALVTSNGDLLPLIPAQSPLPFPSDNSFEKVKLRVPKDRLFVNELRFEVVGQSNQQRIFNEIWKLPKTVISGAEITMEYRVSMGKQFQCRAYFSEDPEALFEHSVENPLVNVLNPQITRLKIEEMEEMLRKKGGGGVDDRDAYVQLAKWYGELNQKERALDYLRTISSRLGIPDVEILNLQGIYFGELGDHSREEKAYKEAAAATDYWDGPLFNLALSYRRRGMHKEALSTIESAIQKYGVNGPSLTLKAMSLETLGMSKEAKETFRDAIIEFRPFKSLDDWQMGWCWTAAKLLQKDDIIAEVEEIRKERRTSLKKEENDLTPRPEPKGDLIKKR